jgi:hypothetical protein
VNNKPKKALYIHSTGMVESILRYSDERYFDSVTQRRIVVGRHDRFLVMISYSVELSPNITAELNENGEADDIYLDNHTYK